MPSRRVVRPGGGLAGQAVIVLVTGLGPRAVGPFRGLGQPDLTAMQ